MVDPTTPPLDFEHEPGHVIPTKHKEAIRQLYGFAKVPVERLMERYRLGNTTIVKILWYDKPEHSRPNQGSLNHLTDNDVDKIIEYISQGWDQRVLD
jgi:hypothetical protein